MKMVYQIREHGAFITVSEIASNLAFCSQSYFSTRFKENVGITPLQFRKVTENENMF